LTTPGPRTWTGTIRPSSNERYYELTNFGGEGITVRLNYNSTGYNGIIAYIDGGYKATEYGSYDGYLRACYKDSEGLHALVGGYEHPVYYDRATQTLTFEKTVTSGTATVRAMVGKEEAAERIFSEQQSYMESVASEPTGMSAAFFYISSQGTAVVRKGSDYVAEMIELAGGTYAFTDIGQGDETATGSANLEMETFYSQARDADVVIYNSSIDGEVASVQELLGKSQLLADFKAVREGNVWCTNKNLFQETTEFGLMISDMNQIFTGQVSEDEDLNFLYRLK
jgi:hypothetical protein